MPGCGNKEGRKLEAGMSNIEHPATWGLIRCRTLDAGATVSSLPHALRDASWRAHLLRHGSGDEQRQRLLHQRLRVVQLHVRAHADVVVQHLRPQVLLQPEGHLQCSDSRQHTVQTLPSTPSAVHCGCGYMCLTESSLGKGSSICEGMSGRVGGALAACVVLHKLKLRGEQLEEHSGYQRRGRAMEGAPCCPGTAVICPAKQAHGPTLMRLQASCWIFTLRRSRYITCA